MILFQSILIILFCLLSAGGEEGIQTDGNFPREKIKTCTDLMINHDYDLADTYIEKNFNDDRLTLLFLRSSLVHARMGDLETVIDIDFFSSISSELIEFAEKKLTSDPDDLKSLFYSGTVTGYISVAEMKKGNVWNAYRKAAESKEIMEQCLKIDPEFIESYLLIGSCNYWLSAKNLIRKVTRIFDNRRKGISQIKSSVVKGSMNYAFGLNQLIWIHLDQKEYYQAESYVEEGLAEYPDSRFFLYPAAEMYKRSERWKEAADYYEMVVQSLEEDNLSNRYFYLKNKLKLAEVRYALGETDSALRLCEEIKNKVIIDDERAAAANILDKAEDLKKSSLKKQNK
ncbi:tetratricopeptide repeat protein [candidate division KSB1 bacterium]